jgi:hypothetical protein
MVRQPGRNADRQTPFVIREANIKPATAPRAVAEH